MSITYTFEWPDGKTARFEVELDRATAEPSNPEGWTRLDVEQCENCPLAGDQVQHCPTAADLDAVVTEFAEVISYDRARVTVETEHRSISKDCDVQEGLTALLGLIMASSACPTLSRLKGLSRTHLPFQSLEESVVRFFGAYTVGQIIAERRGEAGDWKFEGLQALFEELHQVNRAFSRRVRYAAKRDAAMNAVSALALQALGIQLSVGEFFENLEDVSIRDCVIDKQPGSPRSLGGQS